jgi:hypothetical protein
MISRVGAELVIHGHNHIGSLAWLEGPTGRVPVVGAPSASSRGGTLVQGAEYNMYSIGKGDTGFLLSAERRGLGPEGRIESLGLLPLKT